MTGLYLRFHVWRGVSLVNLEPDLFHYVVRLGFVTIYVCKRCLLDAYRKMRSAVQNAIAPAERDDQEGR